MFSELRQAVLDELEELRAANEAFAKREKWWNNRMFDLEVERDALLRWKSTHAPRIEALEGLLRHEQIEAAKGKEAIASLASEREANAILTAEVEALRANAERYLHLRNNSATYPSPSVPIQLIAQPSWSSQFDGYRKHLDAAIDAAMKEKSNG